MDPPNPCPPFYLLRFDWRVSMPSLATPSLGRFYVSSFQFLLPFLLLELHRGPTFVWVCFGLDCLDC